MPQVERGVAAKRVMVPVQSLISQDTSQCASCWACVRHCPAHALRVKDDVVEVIAERCVKCGNCVSECKRSGHRIREDLARVLELLIGGRPVVALLASEHVAAMHPLTTPQVETALEALGFAGVETTVLGEELVAAAYEVAQDRPIAPMPRLRSTCPVAVEWVRRFHPQMVDALLPVIPPYIAQARLVRELYPSDVAIVYVSPCWARKDEVYSAEFLGDVDVAIGFDELRRLIESAPPIAHEDARPRHVQAAKQLSATDGFPRRTLRDHSLDGNLVRTVRGLPDIDRLLTAIRRGETAPSIVDMLSCEGCIDGPCVNNELSVFAKRTIDASERERQPPPAVDSRTFLSALPPVDLHRTLTAQPAATIEPSSDEVDRILAAGEFFTRDETIDCGLCGYDTCVEHAAAIWLGNSSWHLCVPYERKLMKREHQHLSEVSMTDDLTGLMNRRAFDRRLAEEIARASRYSTPLSLVTLDVDDFKDVNDKYGHAAGDALLRAIGVLLRAETRVADIAVRTGGDEFALLLPGIGKTGAWAVAEKVRQSMKILRAHAGDGVYVNATFSVGVAAFGGLARDAEGLLRAGDGALYAAKAAGRDRVELAAG